jgi:3-methyladenine DNA glycosylase AlkD
MKFKPSVYTKVKTIQIVNIKSTMTIVAENDIEADKIKETELEKIAKKIKEKEL